MCPDRRVPAGELWWLGHAARRRAACRHRRRARGSYRRACANRRCRCARGHCRAAPVAATAAPAAETAGDASGDVTVLLIGKPDEDGIDPVTGNPIPGIHTLKEQFAASHPNINLEIINIPWGSGATGYAPKTEAMITANEACVYLMPGAPDFGRRGLLVNLDTLIAERPQLRKPLGRR